MTTKKKSTRDDYISNQDFYETAKRWVYINREAQKITPLPDDMAVYIMKLVNNFAKRRCYAGYTYLEDMKAEALLTVCKYGHNFNPDKTTNAFSYYTQVIDNAFRAYLNKEKNQQDIKAKHIAEDPHLYKLNRDNIKLYDEEAEVHQS